MNIPKNTNPFKKFEIETTFAKKKLFFECLPHFWNFYRVGNEIRCPVVFKIDTKFHKKWLIYEPKVKCHGQKPSWRSWLARQSHNLKVVSSSLTEGILFFENQKPWCMIKFGKMNFKSRCIFSVYNIDSYTRRHTRTYSNYYQIHSGPFENSFRKFLKWKTKFWKYWCN